MNIAIDFDGVIHRYSKGWQVGSIYDPPVDGTLAALEALTQLGHKLSIYSTRAKEQRSDMINWLTKHRLERFFLADNGSLAIHSEKPLCHVLIDDRALRFEGDWDGTMLKLERLGPDGSSWTSKVVSE